MNKFFTILLIGFCGLPMVKAEELLERSYRHSYAAPSEGVVLEVARGVIEVSNGVAGGPVEFAVVERLQRVKQGGTGLIERLTPDLVPKNFNYEKVFARMAPRCKADTRQVRLEVADSHQLVFDWDPSLQMVIEVRVTVPPGTALRIRNVAAGVTLADGFTGNVDIRSEGGSVFAQTVKGDLIARTANGSITVSEVTGRSELRSDSGLVLAGRLHGPANLRTSTGSVEVQHAYDDLKVRGDHAEIVLGLSTPMPKSIDLETSAGAITVNIDQNVPMSLDASTGLLGKVRVRGLEPAVKKGAFNASSLLGDLNGGGTVARLRTSGGSIALVGRTPLDG